MRIIIVQLMQDMLLNSPPTATIRIATATLGKSEQFALTHCCLSAILCSNFLGCKLSRSVQKDGKIMSASLPGNRELPVSQYDLSSYWGRVRHAADISDPR